MVIAAPVARWDAIRAHRRRVISWPRSCSSRAASAVRTAWPLALERCGGHEWITVHDAARPLTPPELFRAVLDAAREDGAATAGVPCVDTVKQVQHGRVAATLDRSSIVAAQTPQSFSADLLRRAHRNAVARGISAGDDAALVEALGEPVTVVPGRRA